MEGLHPEAGYMTASVPKRVFSLESPLTARAGPYMYLLAADNSPGPGIEYNAPLHYHVRGYCHDSTPLLLSAHRLGTPVAVCHVVSDMAKPQWASRTEARYA